jgi:NAD(P)-dependent dehydrogenase (short-subunit alcohol dehydrogenase family)
MLSINLRSCVLCTDAVVPEMRRRRTGRIVNVTSEAAFNGAARNWDYAAAKSGITGFTRAMARELAPFAITVNAVAPGATRTRAMEAMPQDLLAQILARIPMGRMGEPEEVADVIAFFAGRQSSYVTGQTLLVNGGNWHL